MSAGVDVNRIITSYHFAQDAVNYADAIVIEAQVNEDDDYTMVWTNAYSGNFPPEE